MPNFGFLNRSVYKHSFSKTVFYLNKNKAVVLLFCLFLVLAFINTLHFSYPDEFENILGGYYIDHGRLPYVGFFAQHAPFAYFFASLITLISGPSFVRFRLLLAPVYVFILGLFYLYTRNRINKYASQIFLTFLGLILLGATYYWGQMLLADSLAGLLLIPGYIFLFLLIFYRIKPGNLDFIILSALLSTGVLTSLTYIYAVCILYLFLVIYYLSVYNKELFSKKTLYFLLILITPYLIFLIYLLVTHSLKEFYYDAIYFNQQYYIAMPDGKPVTNPIRFAVVLFYKFFQSFRSVLALSKDFNLSFPFADTLALSDFFMIIYLLIKRKFKLALMMAGTLVYLNGRSNPSTTSETDYQAIPYQYFSMFNGIFLLFILWEEMKDKAVDAKKFIFGGILLILGIYYSALSLMYFDKFFEKAYLKYMGQQSLIYDRPQVANQINQILTPNDYYWVGPFAFEDEIYTKEKLASKYIVTIPAMDHSKKIQGEMLADFEQTKPKLVVFDTEYRIFGELPGEFLVNYLEQHYFTLEDLPHQGYKIHINENNFGDYHLDRHFFIRKDSVNEILNKMASLGYISLN